MINIYGNKNKFAITSEYFLDSKTTELCLFINGINIMEFENNGKILTTRGNLDELVKWLNNFINNIFEDPIPFNNNGLNLAEKASLARNFDSDDDEMFDAYYDTLDDWCYRHMWLHTNQSFILANVFFGYVNGLIEISWLNNYYKSVKFLNYSGRFCIEKDEFVEIIKAFVNDYVDFWYNKDVTKDIM